jgi:hypothetical protein
MLGPLRCVLLAIVLCGAGGGAPVQRGAGWTEGAQRPIRLERLRERLRARPAEERVRLERNLEEFARLPAEERAKLLERARALREWERSVGRAVPRELRQRMEELDAERARALWVTHLRERFRERGRALRERLPESLRQRLEQAPPEARRRFFERFLRERERLRARLGPGAAERGPLRR